jgi:hypothetical protein
MNTHQVKETKLLRNTAKLNEYIKVKGECPKCSSYYLNDSECESCGFQLNFDVVGNDFGPRSFYFMKEFFVDNQSWLESKQPKNIYNKSKKVLKYKRMILRRFRELLDFSNFSGVRDGYIVLECRSIIHEYISLGGSGKELSLYLDRGESYFSTLNNDIVKCSMEFDEDVIKLKEKWINKQTIFFFKFILSISFVCFCSFILFLYFIS